MEAFKILCICALVNLVWNTLLKVFSSLFCHFLTYFDLLYINTRCLNSRCFGGKKNQNTLKSNVEIVSALHWTTIISSVHQHRFWMQTAAPLSRPSHVKNLFFSQEQTCLLQSGGFFMHSHPYLLCFLRMVNVAASALHWATTAHQTSCGAGALKCCSSPATMADDVFGCRLGFPLGWLQSFMQIFNQGDASSRMSAGCCCSRGDQLPMVLSKRGEVRRPGSNFLAMHRNKCVQTDID